MSFADRLKQARKGIRMSQQVLADGIGVSQNTISDWEHGRYEPSLDLIGRVARHMDVDPAVLTGTSPMPSTLAAAASSPVPEYDISVAAGAGAVISDSPPIAHWPFPSKLFEDMRRPAEAFVMFTVMGDSMEPTLKSGDRILVDTSKTSPSAPGIYVIATDDFAAVKRLEMIPGGKPARVRIRSDNPLHGSFESNLRDVRVIGWVAGVLTIF